MLRYVTIIKRMREQTVGAHLLFYFLNYVGVWVRINIRIIAMDRVWARFRVGVRNRIAIF